MVVEDTINHYIKLSVAGPNNPKWKGGRYISTEGYVFVKCWGHPRANKGGYVFEHILVMEQHIGRYITTQENVHHINGVRTDNRIENLEVLTRGQHTKHHNLNTKQYKSCR
jgi:hypothetical protein